MLDINRDWWKQAVVYQVYPRSFSDANGDGLGDLAGVTANIPYLKALGVDALWLSPFYPSPLVDGGYDVADYRNVDPRLGTLDDFDRMCTAAHEAGIKVIVDIVPNHTSTEHPWFKDALAAEPGSAERDRYIFRPGRGDAGELPPNGWQSTFGGSAWEPVGDGTWYLHLFAVEQADLNWKNPEVRAEFERTIRFWCDRGADGFRVDVAHALMKDLDTRPLEEWPDNPAGAEPDGSDPLWDRPEVHEIYRSWRSIFNEYEPPRFAVAEAWVVPEHQWMYASTDELGQVFNFELSKAAWCAEDFRRALEEGLDAAKRSGSTTTWVLSNHDLPRHTTRFGLPQVPARTQHQLVTDWLLRDGTTYVEDRALGTRRARAAILLELALPGSIYIYQGEELGLFEVADIPWDQLEDPQARMTNHGVAIKGRDGCRVPLPWKANDPTGAFGFSTTTEHAAPHLPQPAWFKDLAVDVEEQDPTSMLNLYRIALKVRAELLKPLGDTSLTWGTGYSDQVICYARPATSGRTLTCIINFGATAVPLPEGEVVLSSVPVEENLLPDDATAWVVH